MNAIAALRVAALALLVAACGDDASRAVPLNASPAAPILLFAGTGASRCDVAAIETVLNDQQLRYSLASSEELNEMSAARLRSFQLLIMPGGDFVAMSEGLTPGSTAKIRDAVHDGLNYLGICAGAFLAGHFPSYDSIDLASGVQFRFYSASNDGIRKAAVAIARPGMPALDQYWEDGPQLSGWGQVIGRYPDGTPAIVQGMSERGWVILSGVHPEAPESWRAGMSFGTPAEVDNAYAATLIRAALERSRLPHF